MNCSLHLLTIQLELWITASYDESEDGLPLPREEEAKPSNIDATSNSTLNHQYLHVSHIKMVPVFMVLYEGM